MGWIVSPGCGECLNISVVVTYKGIKGRERRCITFDECRSCSALNVKSANKTFNAHVTEPNKDIHGPKSLGPVHTSWWYIGTYIGMGRVWHTNAERGVHLNGLWGSKWNYPRPAMVTSLVSYSSVSCVGMSYAVNYVISLALEDIWYRCMLMAIMMSVPSGNNGKYVVFPVIALWECTRLYVFAIQFHPGVIL